MSVRSVVLCYAPEDEFQAHSLARFLEANLKLKVFTGECVVREGFDLIDAVDRGISAEFAVALLSRASMPSKWDRNRWEPVFNDQVAALMLEECTYPPVLRRARFFRDRRALKQWFLYPALASAPAVSSPLRDALSDAPGVAENVPAREAAEFIDECALDFEAVYRIDCHERTRAGIAGEIRRSGISTEERALLVLDGFPAQHRDLIEFPLASVLCTAGTQLTRPRIETLAAGWELLKVLDPEYREEALELLEHMSQFADAEALRHIARRKAWLSGEAPQVVAIGEQLCLSL